MKNLLITMIVFMVFMTGTAWTDDRDFFQEIKPGLTVEEVATDN